MSPVRAPALDPFLEHLRAAIPLCNMIREYDDLIAITLVRLEDIEPLAAPFKLLEQASNLCVNIWETVVIVCFESSVDAIRQRIVQME